MASDEELDLIKLRIRALDDAMPSDTAPRDRLTVLLNAILDEIMHLQSDLMPARMPPRIIPSAAIEKPDEAA